MSLLSIKLGLPLFGWLLEKLGWFPLQRLVTLDQRPRSPPPSSRCLVCVSNNRIFYINKRKNNSLSNKHIWTLFNFDNKCWKNRHFLSICRRRKSIRAISQNQEWLKQFNDYRISRQQQIPARQVGRHRRGHAESEVAQSASEVVGLSQGRRLRDGVRRKFRLFEDSTSEMVGSSFGFFQNKVSRRDQCDQIWLNFAIWQKHRSIWATFWIAYLVFSKLLYQLWHFYATGQIVIVVNGQRLNSIIIAICSHWQGSLTYLLPFRKLFLKRHIPASFSFIFVFLTILQNHFSKR